MKKIFIAVLLSFALISNVSAATLTITIPDDKVDLVKDSFALLYNRPDQIEDPENNPFKMGLIVCVIISCFAFAFHYLNVSPHNLGGLFLWLPVTWVLPLSASTFSYLTKEKEE